MKTKSQTELDIDHWCDELNFVSLILETLKRSMNTINLHSGEYFGDEMLLAMLQDRVDELYRAIDEARWKIEP